METSGLKANKEKEVPFILVFHSKLRNCLRTTCFKKTQTRYFSRYPGVENRAADPKCEL